MGSKRQIDEEIEVDINAPKPLNKKQKRLLKKGKIEEPKPEDINAKPKPRSPYAVWIGNLSFATTSDGLRNFIIEKTADVKTPITRDDITRIKLPSRKGFAYVDVKTEDQMKELVSLSESRLDNRNLLIKEATSYEGRPEEHAEGQKNPPSRILFVGNLSFDTTDEQLEMHFQHHGEIRRIRTATFQDTGKCKGFSFIDFKTEEAATSALKDPSSRKMNGRTLRMEYGEDRSARRPKVGSAASENGESAASSSEPRASRTHDASNEPRRERPDNSFSAPPKPYKKDSGKSGKVRPTPGAALASAARSKQSILPSVGKKMTFD